MIPKFRLPKLTYRSERFLIYGTLMSWAAITGAGVAAAVDHFLPGAGFFVALPIECALVFTAAWAANRLVRARDLARTSEVVLNEEERLREEYEEAKAELLHSGLMGHDLAAAKMQLLQGYLSARRELRELDWRSRNPSNRRLDLLP